MSTVPAALVILDKVFVLTSLAGCLAWIAEYTRSRGWRNEIGRTLLVKTSLLAALLALSALNLYFHLNRQDSLAIAWAGVLLLGAIGPVMAWRLLVFRRAARGVRLCPNGHAVASAAARFCPQCGVPVTPPGVPDPG